MLRKSISNLHRLPTKSNCTVTLPALLQMPPLSKKLWTQHIIEYLRTYFAPSSNSSKRKCTNTYFEVFSLSPLGTRITQLPPDFFQRYAHSMFLFLQNLSFLGSCIDPWQKNMYNSAWFSCNSLLISTQIPVPVSSK